MKNRILILATVVLGLASLSALAQSVDGSITLQTSSADGMLTPTLTWQTNAPACVASGDAEWEGVKPPSGTQTLSPRPTSQPRAFALLCSGPEDSTALLTWTPPTTNTDGSALTNLAGFRLYWGEQSSALVNTVQIDNPSANSYAISELAPRTWFFAVRAFTAQGSESQLSNIISKTTHAAVEWSQQTGIKVPNAPTVEIE